MAEGLALGTNLLRPESGMDRDGILMTGSVARPMAPSIPGDASMPRKPTTPYGYIAFSKSGKVRKHISRLSDDKRKQEEEVARQFCEFLGRRNEMGISYRMLEERDHDFLLVRDGSEIVVQITEIAQREYLAPLSDETYRLGQSGFTNFYVGEDGQMSGVNVQKRDGMIAQRITEKCAKYAKPSQNAFWLLIFTSDASLSPVVFEAGTRVETAALLTAKNLCASKGCGPFDQVWFMVLGLKPHRIWPHENENQY